MIFTAQQLASYYRGEWAGSMDHVEAAATSRVVVPELLERVAELEHTVRGRDQRIRELEATVKTLNKSDFKALTFDQRGKEEYRPKTLQQKLGYLVEECGEVLAAAGKTLRWGTESVNPELPHAEQETNREWILRELADLRLAVDLAESSLKSTDALSHPGDQREAR